MAGYFLKGEVVDPAATPIIAARKALAKCDEFNAEAKDLALKSMVNWEVLLSQFGSQKADVWQFLIESNLVGYMALLRNLRNLLDADVSDATLKTAVSKLADPKEVERSRQLPFRFLMAHQVLTDHFGTYTSSYGYGRQPKVVKSRSVSKMLEAIEEAANLAVVNLPVLPGLTAIFADNSGSMDCPVSEKSQMTCAGAANALCGIVAKQSADAVVAAFGTAVAGVPFTKHDTVIGIANKVRHADTKGMSTNAYLIPKWLDKQGIKPDRVILLSDMQCWNSSTWGYSDKPLCDEWKRFAKSNPQTWLHSIHLNGYGDTPVKDGKVNLASGFSEKVFDMLLQAEGIAPAGETEPVPTIEQIRQNHKI
jgi:hypothetical protein